MRSGTSHGVGIARGVGIDIDVGHGRFREGLPGVRRFLVVDDDDVDDIDGGAGPGPGRRRQPEWGRRILVSCGRKWGMSATKPNGYRAAPPSPRSCSLFGRRLYACTRKQQGRGDRESKKGNKARGGGEKESRGAHA